MKYEVNNIYHIYNQGNNQQRIFFSESNYEFFLKKMTKHLLPHVDILAYCLMPNHFHWLVRTNDSACQNSCAVKPCARQELERIAIQSRLNHGLDAATEIAQVPSRQQNLSHQIGQLVSSYTKAINKQEKRSGSLFRAKTKSKNGGEAGPSIMLGGSEIKQFNELNPYWRTCFNYIHDNPVKSRLTLSPQGWKFSSIHEYQSIEKQRLVNFKLAEYLELI